MKTIIFVLLLIPMTAFALPGDSTTPIFCDNDGCRTVPLITGVTVTITAVQCVDERKVIAAWKRAINKANDALHGTVKLTLDCDPCSCGHWGSAGCYQWLADITRAKEEQENVDMELLIKADINGIFGR